MHLLDLVVKTSLPVDMFISEFVSRCVQLMLAEC
jgi:hypothetical protein